jgi:hypothetical protein
MKLYLINLISFGLRSEWGYWGYQRCDKPDNIHDYVSSAEIQQVKDIISDENNKVILHAVSETWSVDAISSILSQLEVTPDLPNVKLVVDTCITEWRPTNVLNFPATYYSHDLMKVANYEDKFGCNTEINLSTNRFLYLMGKPYKPHRIGLLHQLYCFGLLDHCDWSFTLHDSIYKKTRDILPQLTDAEFDEFVQNTTRTLDNIDILGAESGRYFYEGIPYDTAMYKNTSFSLISETMVMPKCITEKTWRTIANRHAFTTLGGVECFRWLNNLGIDTFDYLRPVTQDQNIANTGALNSRYMLTHITEHQSEIKNSIESNYNVYRRLAGFYREKIDEVIEPYLTLPFTKSPPIIERIDDDVSDRAISKLWCCW